MEAEYRVEFREIDDYVIPTVWIGVQGFDLVNQYADGDWSPQKKAEWFSSMFKKAIDNYAAPYCKEQIRTEIKLIESDIESHGDLYARPDGVHPRKTMLFALNNLLNKL